VYHNNWLRLIRSPHPAVASSYSVRCHIWVGMQLAHENLCFGTSNAYLAPFRLW
jgi:hypothetical protein